jgi:hypothetical protein
MVDQDPQCAAMLLEMRSTLRGVAAALPAVVLVDDERTSRPFQFILDRLAERVGHTKQLPPELTPRELPNSGLAEQAAGLGGGALGAGATAKIVAMCIAAGGTAAACVEGIRLFDHNDTRTPRKRAPQHRANVSKPVKPHVVRVAVKQPPPTTPTRPKKKPARRETPVSSPKSRPPASPAPPGSTEFGPGNVGSTPRSTAPAPAPANGGGEFTP